MNQKYKHIFQHINIGGITFRSRLAAAPMGFPDITPDGCIAPGMTAFYELRALGGAAAVTVSEAMTHPTGRTHGRVIDLTNPAVIASLTNTARAIRRHGAVASLELNHGGKSDTMDAAPGAGKSASGDGKTSINEMSAELIREIVRSFGDGAAMVKRAGFDMVTVHGGHGWLIEQFLSPAVNRRTDGYGGSLENRTRLLREILASVRAAVGGKFPIELRISAVEDIPGGYDVDYAIRFVKLVENQIDLLHVSAGFGEENFAVTHPPMFALHGVNVKYAAAIKKQVSVPVATVGALNDPKQIDEIIASEQADVVCLARALLADPELPRKAESGRDDEITRCLRCFTCHAERTLTQTRICSVNPMIGREEEALRLIQNADFAVAKAPRAKRVLVAGGGPAGLTAALWAARRGHTVTLCEKRIELGGALLSERGIDFKRESLDFVRTMETLLRREKVSLRLGVEVTSSLVRTIKPEALIVAVGAAPVIPDISGVGGDNVISANALYENADRVGKLVAVLGGGLVGCETALHLKNRGHDVTIIEMGPELAPDANPRHRPILLSELESVPRRTHTRAIGITKAGVNCTDMYGMLITVPANTVILAVGQRPLRDAADALRDIAPQTAFIGDCVSARNIREATFRGYHAALDL